MKLIVTEDLKYLRIAEAEEIELEQLNFSLKKRIRGWFFNPLVKKKKYGMVTSIFAKIISFLLGFGVK
jgi:hypothetical protein